MTSLPQWLGFGLTVLVVLAGTGANLFFMGRFVGKWGELMKNLSKSVEDVDARLDRNVTEIGARLDEEEARGGATAHAVDLLGHRVAGAEVAVAKFWEMREEFIAMRTTIEIEGKAQREGQESIKRSMSVIERQLANLLTARPEILRLHNDERN